MRGGRRERRGREKQRVVWNKGREREGETEIQSEEDERIVM